MANYQRLPERSDNDFPSGMKVLVVDNDLTTVPMLTILLAECGYKFKTCSQATRVLSLLRENREGFDIVLVDVDMLGINRFRFLQQVGLEMDLPVIIMSADGNIKAAMKGILQGACGYMVKPVSKKELKTIWQHVVRKRLCSKNDTSHSLSHDKEKTRGPSEESIVESIVEIEDEDQYSEKEKDKDVPMIWKILGYIGTFFPFWFFTCFLILSIVRYTIGYGQRHEGTSQQY